MKNKIDILICDDIPLWKEKIKESVVSYFNKIKMDCHIIATTKMEEAEDYCKQNPNGLRICLLDIDLTNTRGNAGIHFAKDLQKYNKNTVIIFVTFYAEFSLEAYQVRGFKYILKPISQQEMENALRESIVYLRGMCALSVGNIITINKRIQVKENRIIYITTNGRLIDICTTQGTISTRLTLKELKEKLNNDFIYISQSVIINIEYLVFYKEKTVTLVGGKEFAISNKYDVQERLANPI